MLLVLAQCRLSPAAFADLPLRLLVKASVLDGNSRLLGKEGQQVQVIGREPPRRIGGCRGKDTQPPPTHLERGHQHAVDLGIRGQMSLPILVIVDDHRLAGLGHPAHGSLPQGMAGPGIVLAQVMAHHDPDLFLGLVIQAQLAAGGIQQTGSPGHDGLKQGGQIQFGGDVGHGGAQRIELVSTPAFRGQQPCFADGQASLLGSGG